MKVPKARSGELVHNGTERSVRASVCVSVRHVSAVYVYDVCEWCVCVVCAYAVVYVCVWWQQR